MKRTFISALGAMAGEEIILRGWVHRVRTLARTSFIIDQCCADWSYAECRCVA